MSGCIFDRRDQHSHGHGPLSSQTLGTSSLGIFREQNGPNACMIESSWVTMTKAERLILTKGERHVQWKVASFAKEKTD